MKTIKSVLLVFLIGTATCSMSFAQNYKAPKIDASGKVTDESGTFMGSVTHEGVIKDAKGEKIGYINSNGMLVDGKGVVIGKPEKNGNFTPYFDGKPDTAMWTITPPANGTCLVKNSKGEVVAVVHENYKMYGACAIHCIQNHMKHGEVLDKSKKTETYSCPMHHNHTSDKPGKCPDCGMDMTK